MIRLTAFTGVDMEGDACIYISASLKKYRTEDQLAAVVRHLNYWLNSEDCPPSVRKERPKPDPAEIDKLYEELTKGQDDGKTDQK